MEQVQTLYLEAAFGLEAAMLASVKAGGGPQAALWRAQAQALVAPRAMEAALAPGLAASAAAGWPCRFRGTGGDVTPQGPGVVSLSLAFRQPKAGPDPIAAAYGRITTPLLEALAALGVPAQTGPVAGSYCDGAHNVVVHGLKFAGTAQRMSQAGEDWAVLAHALMTFDGESAPFVDAINALYEAAGLERHVAQGVTTSLKDLGLEPRVFLAALRAALGEYEQP